MRRANDEQRTSGWYRFGPRGSSPARRGPWTPAFGSLAPVRAFGSGLVAVASLGACQSMDWDVPDDAVFSEGCGGAEPAAIVEYGQLTVDSIERDYVARFPGSYRPDFPFPLLVSFHGAGDSGSGFRSFTRFDEATRGRAILVYPDALEDEGGTRWDTTTDGPDFALFDALTESFSREYCVDRSRVFVVGYSNGAALANQLGCTRADELRAMAAVAGGGPWAECAGPLPTLIAHGSRDPVVPIEEGVASRDQWRMKNGCDDESEGFGPDPCVAYTGCAEPVVWCEHDNPVQVAHGWPDFVEDAVWGLFSGL